VRLAYPALFAPSAPRDHFTHAIARDERDECDATAKEEQKRLIQIHKKPRQVLKVVLYDNNDGYRRERAKES
jgi:hypothetical protein